MDPARLSLKRRLEIDNAIKVADDVFSGRTRWEGRPFHVEVSTNNACNLACIMCERPDLAFIEAHTLNQLGGAAADWPSGSNLEYTGVIQVTL